MRCGLHIHITLNTCIAEIYILDSVSFPFQAAEVSVWVKALFTLMVEVLRYIKSLHFTPCILEPCLFHTIYMGACMYHTIHVDNIIIAYSLAYELEVKMMFCKNFDMTA